MEGSGWQTNVHFPKFCHIFSGHEEIWIGTPSTSPVQCSFSRGVAVMLIGVKKKTHKYHHLISQNKNKCCILSRYIIINTVRMTEVNVQLEKFLNSYFEKNFQEESEPIKDAIQTSLVLSELRKHINSSKTEKISVIDQVSENTPPNKGTENAADVVELLRSTLSTQLEEYHRVALQRTLIQSDINEIRSEYMSACGQLKRQINVADEHRLDSALRVFEMLDSDEKRGGYGRLHSLIEIGITSIEDSIKSLSSKIAESRKEYVAIRHSEDLLECCARASYERVRDSYMNLLRTCRKRSHESDMQWSKLESDCREWLLSEMKSTHERYAHSRKIDDIGTPASVASPMEKSRIETGRRFQKFSDHYISTADQRQKRSIGYLEALRQSRTASVRYKEAQGALLEDWLESTTRNMDECYAESIEELQERVSAIRLHITGLELHQRKLSHLTRVKSKVQSTPPESRPPSQRDRGQSLLLRGQSKHSISMSMNLGKRMHDLATHVGVEPDECVMLLTQLLHTVNPDNAVIHKLNQYVNHYSKRMASRI
jgi:hypothetical protein